MQGRIDKATPPILDKLEQALKTGDRATIKRVIGKVSGQEQLYSRWSGHIEKLFQDSGELRLLRTLLRRGQQDVQPRMRRRERPADAAPSSIWQRADRQAGRVRINAAVADLLFNSRQDKSLDRREWEQRLGRAEAIERLISDRGFNKATFAELLHPDSQARLHEAVPDGKAAIFLVGHIGFTPPRNYFIRNILRNSIPFRREYNHPPYTWKQDDAKTALFCCLRALQSGVSVVIAPDGPIGEARAPITVAGRETTMATGANFLAHEAKCPVVWLNIVVEQDRFVPEIIVGPEPEKGERLKAFTPRVVSFYQDRLNAHFAGDPANIVIRNRWKGRLLGIEDNSQDQDDDS